MKKYLFSIIIVFLMLFIAQPVEAINWKCPVMGDEDADCKAGTCIMVDQRSEADSNHVYTLNPDNTVQLNNTYYGNWMRNASCSELQFQVDHNTPLTRLDSWLKSIAWGWYKNIGNTHFKHKTVSTVRGEWFFIDEAGARRIADWPTAMTHGLLVEDNISIPLGHTEAFYKFVKIADPLKYTEGAYYQEFQEIWDGGHAVESSNTIPQRLLDEINDLGFGVYGYLTEKYPCSIGTAARGFHCRTLNFSYAITLN